MYPIDGVRLFFNILATEAEGPRELAQQDVLLGLAGGAMWGGGGSDDLYCDGRPVPPALACCTACHAKRLLSCEILAIPADDGGGILAIYAPMIYTALCIMFWVRAYPLRGQLGGGWALEIESFLGPVKWH
jgi:hypothetical protein